MLQRMSEREAVQVPVLLWHPDGRRVAVQDGAFPTITVKLGDDVGRAVQEAWNLPVWLLDDAGVSFGLQGGVPRLRALAEDFPSGLEWQEVTLPDLPFERVWQRPDWPEVVQERLARAGLVNAQAKPLYANDLVCIVQAEHDGETSYLKASLSGREVRNTALVSQCWPHLAAPLIHAVPQEGWMVTQSGGKLLDGVADLSAWTQAIRRLAEFQRRADAKALAELGCPAYPLAQMSEKVPDFLSQTQVLQDWGLATEKISALQNSLPSISQAFKRLAALGLPDLPAHGDTHVRNALHGECGSVWFDWSEVSSAAHPLMDFGWFLAFALHPAREKLPIRQAQPELENKLISAVLNALDLPPETAPLVSAAIPLAYLHRAVIYDAAFRDWQGNIPNWRPNYVPYYLRQAVGELPRLTA